MMSPQLHIELAGADRVDKVRDLWLSLHHHHRRVATFQPLVDDDAVSWERRRALYLDRFDPNPAFLALALRGDTVVGYAFVCIEDGPDDTFPVGAHYLDEAQRLCDRVAIIHSGEIVALDTPAALLGGLGDELLELRVDGDADTALAALRRRGALGDDAFAVGSSLTVPLRGRSGRDVLTAIVIAPALKKALGGLHTNIDYISFVSVGTVGLLVPLAPTFAGLSVIVDRDSGAQRELLAAPIRRAPLVFGNLAVVMVLAAFQVVTVIAVAALRGGEFNIRLAGVLWFSAATVMFVVMMYGIAEALAAKIHHQEEYIGATPVIAILPWFFAGALFPIGVLPGAMSAFAKLLPLTHAMALMRYGLVDPRGTGLHNIWGIHSTTTSAWLSLAVVLVFAAAFIVLAVRAFTRSAVR